MSGSRLTLLLYTNQGCKAPYSKVSLRLSAFEAEVKVTSQPERAQAGNQANQREISMIHFE